MKKSALAFTLATFTASALANNGYFSSGFGTTAKGMGGAATALAKDAFGAANNPAALAFVPDQIEFGVELILPHRSVDFSGTGGAFDGAATSKKEFFIAPDFAVSKKLSERFGAGLAVYPNGGGNAHFPGGQVAAGSFPGCSLFNPPGATGPFNLLCGTGPLGVSLEQVIIAPALAYRLNADHAVGVAPLLGVQRFRLLGRQTLDSPLATLTPGKTSNNGYDYAFGAGVRVGYQGQVLPGLRVGAAWASKMDFNRFDDYRGLLVNGGEVDIAENFNLGLAWQARADLTIALDYQRIRYSETPVVANSSANALRCPAEPEFCSGGSQASGLGWRDVGVWKLGVEWQANEQLALRAGYSDGRNQVPPEEVTISVVAPAITERHASLGASWRLGKFDTLNFAYVRALPNSLTGPSAFNSYFQGLAGEGRIKLDAHFLGLSWQKSL